MKLLSQKLAFLLGIILVSGQLLSGCGTQSGQGNETANQPKQEAADINEAADSDATTEGTISVSYNQNADAGKGERNYTLAFPEWKDNYSFAAPEEDKVCRIALKTDRAVITEEGKYAENVSIDGNKISILGKGYYEFSGELQGGQIYVAAADEKVHLYFNGVKLENPSDASVYLEEADNVYIGLMEGTENVICSTVKDADDGESQFSENVNNSELQLETDTANKEQSDEVDADSDVQSGADAAIYSRADLIFNGTGSLKIENTDGNGIHSTKDLVFVEGNYDISAGTDAVKGKDLLSVYDGSFTLEAVGAGLKATNNTEEGKGNLYIEKGDFQINSQDDGLHCNQNVIVLGGSFEITTQDDGVHADEVLLLQNAVIDIKESYEGLEGKVVDLVSSDIKVKAKDDGINAASGSGSSEQEKQMNPGENGSEWKERSDIKKNEKTVSGDMPGKGEAPEMELENGDIPEMPMDKAVPDSGKVPEMMPDYGVAPEMAMDKVMPDSGNMPEMPPDGAITDSGEVTEIPKDGNIPGDVENRNMHGGVSDNMAADPNRKGKGTGRGGFGGGMAGDSDCMIYLDNSQVFIDADGDGVDSNGNIYMYSGNLMVEGPTNNGNAALDFQQEFVVYGGNIEAYGSKGMLESLSEKSTVPVLTILLSENYPAGISFEIRNSENEMVRSYSPGKSFSSAVVAGSDLELGDTYRILVNGTELQSITLKEICTQVGESGRTGF